MTSPEATVTIHIKGAALSIEAETEDNSNIDPLTLIGILQTAIHNILRHEYEAIKSRKSIEPNTPGNEEMN